MLTGFFILAGVALSLTQADYIRRSIDAALDGNARLVWRSVGCFAAAVAARLLRDMAYGRVTARIEANLNRDLKNDLTRAILDADMGYMLTQPAGELLTRHNDDTGAVAGFICGGITRFAFEPLMMLGGLVYLMRFNLTLSLITFAATPVLAVLLYKRSGRAGRLHEAQMEKRGVFTESLYDAVQGAETVRAYHMKPYLLNKGRSQADSLRASEVEYCFNDSIALALIMAVSYVPQVLALLFGGGLALRGVISVSLLFAYASLISLINAPAIWVFSAFNDMKKAARSMKRLDEVRLAKQERAGGDASAPVLLPGTPALRFENLSFAYEDAPVLNGVDLTVPMGKHIGLSGESGAGKTTLLNLLCGFYTQQAGRVVVLGRDVDTWDLTALRKHIAYVSQEDVILPGSLYENIRLGDLTASREAVLHAVRRAGLDGLIQALPQGVDTALTENGGNLSGGQRQRICLARAFLKDAPLLVLDEPTASLDPETERFVLHSLAETGDKAVLVISHNPAALAFCDEVYQLSGGRCVKR